MNKTTVLIGTILIGLVVLTGCAQGETNSDEETGEETVAETPTFSLEEISVHNSAEDCWTTVDMKVYDITEFVSNHPGGEGIVNACGIDATELFSEHSGGARNTLDRYHIGYLEE